MSRLAALEIAVRSAAMAYPDTVEDHPWGESAFKVRGKTFLFCSHYVENTLSLSMKLPVSRDFAVEAFEWAEPTSYGLGKSGWVTARLTEDSGADPQLILDWLDESWRTIAPKKLSAAHPAR